jgi:hypothetical protein
MMGDTISPGIHKRQGAPATALTNLNGARLSGQLVQALGYVIIEVRIHG